MSDGSDSGRLTFAGSAPQIMGQPPSAAMGLVVPAPGTEIRTDGVHPTMQDGIKERVEFRLDGVSKQVEVYHGRLGSPNLVKELDARVVHTKHHSTTWPLRVLLSPESSTQFRVRVERVSNTELAGAHLEGRGVSFEGAITVVRARAAELEVHLSAVEPNLLSPEGQDMLLLVQAIKACL